MAKICRTQALERIGRRIEHAGCHRLPAQGEIDIAAVASWANEFFRHRAGPDVQYCIQKCDGCRYPEDRLSYGGCVQRTVSIDDAYLSAEAAVVRERLKMPSVRLWAILNTVLAVTTIEKWFGARGKFPSMKIATGELGVQN